MLSSREDVAEQPEGVINEDASGLVLEPVVRLMEHDDLVSALAADTTSNLLASGSWDRRQVEQAWYYEIEMYRYIGGYHRRTAD